MSNERLRRVIVVEDSDLLDIFVLKLRQVGLEVVSFYDSTIAEEAIKSEAFPETDIAVLDGACPNPGDGERLATLLRTKFPHILISCISGDEYLNWADAVFSKPFVKWDQLKAFALTGEIPSSQRKNDE